MKNLFIPYELAVIAKEKGFAQKEVFRYYSGNGDKLWNYNGKLNKEDVIAPLYQQIVDWFREKHNIYVSSEGMLNKTVKPTKLCFIPTVTTMDEDYDSPFDVDSITDNYYDALNEAINEALKII